MRFINPSEIANLNILNITVYFCFQTILFSEICYLHFLLQEIRSVGIKNESQGHVPWNCSGGTWQLLSG